MFLLFGQFLFSTQIFINMLDGLLCVFRKLWVFHTLLFWVWGFGEVCGCQGFLASGPAFLGQGPSEIPQRQTTVFGVMVLRTTV